MKKINLFIIINLLCLSAFAQQSRTIKGKVLNENHAPIANANVTVFSVTNHALFTLNTNEEGLFSFLSPGQKFYLSVSYIGYIPFRLDQFEGDSVIIALKSSSVKLEEVSISATKPFMEQQLDKMIVNVDGNTKAGINAVEILKKVPGLMIKNNEELMLEGKSVSVMIDGRPTRLSGANLMSLLEGTTSAGISQFEIIYNPSAKYDAAGSGGLINIKTIKREKPGYDANLSINGGHGWKFPTNSDAVGLNYKTGNTNFYGAYSIGLGKQYQEIQTNTYQKDLNQRLQDSSTYRSGYKSNNIRLGFDHSLNKSDALGVLITGYYNTRNPNYISETATYEGNQLKPAANTLSDNINTTTGRGLNLNLNYKHVIDVKKQQEITFDADAGISDYQNYNTNNILTVNTSPIDQHQAYFQDGLTKSGIYSFKGDYTKKLSKGLFETGFKLSNVKIENSFSSLFSSNTRQSEDVGSNDFMYEETILAAYANQRLAMGKFSMLFGLRGEETFTNGNSVTLNSAVERQYLNLFPNATIGLKLKNSSFSLSYSKRIGRPLYNELNPFVMVTSAFTTRSGNPDLRPSYANNLRLAFTLKSKFTIATSYSHSKNVITDLKTRDAQTQITNSLKTNLSSYRNLGLNASYSNKLFKVLQLNYGLGVSNSDYTFLYNAATENINQTTGYLSLGNNIEISPTLWAEVYFYGQSRVTYGNNVNLPFSTTSLSFGKKILQGKGNLNLSINDIFYTGTTRSEANYGNIVYNLKSKYDSRNIRLNFSYRFGNSKIDVRKRSVGSEEEQRRNQ
ncbi:outer membrane beta-barrel protein [Pedobacter duraquae]|uniref:Outer membrane receptor protein involved in Fe transport n=1 Tax=Pedobacter duraquae TaxID=425511 RepID=A0A4R6IFM2_9SPHI|nr:outer membrane beta-barrel protein [Pedobacter duraquae]TDO20892.1 outer membrane receptor protein involved in Fe transport [Pedobacter duraquae]